MIRQCYRARISLVEIEKPIAFVSSNISYKVKQNDHILDVVAEVDVETSNSSEVQGTEKSTSISLVLQSPTHHE